MPAITQTMKANLVPLAAATFGVLQVASLGAIIDANGNFEINQFGVSGDRDRSLAGAVASQPGYVIQRFVLPTLGPGESFDTVSLTVPVGVFFNANGNNGGYDLDLFGLDQNSNALGYNSISPVASMSTDPATLIQASFVDDTAVTGTSLFFVTTSAAANDALRLYLITQYAGGANAGQSIFLRFSPVPPSGGNFDGYDLYNTTGTSEGGNFTAEQTGNAMITYTVIPEPSSFTLLALCAAGLSLVRRRAA